MKFQKEVNIYSPEAIVKRFKANETALSVQKGKIESLISESEIIELQNEKVTMYSKMSDIKQTVNGLNEKYTSIKAGYDAASKQYTELDLKVAKYKKGVDSFSTELTKVKSNLENNYSTTVEMNTAITAKVDEISASVSKTYATKTSVDGIRVGGRNLVKNADRLDGKWSDAGTYASKTKVVDDEYALSGKHIEVKCTKAGPGPNYPVFPKTLDKLNKTYTWSFYAKCSVEKSGTVGHECGGRTQIELTTAWKKFKYTWKYTDEKYSSFTFYLNFKVGEILYIRDFQIEEGTKATSWGLSPEDYSTTAEMNAAIKIRADEITSEVSKKVGASEIISKINQSAEKVSISASKINFNGLVTANNYFKVNTDGSIEAIKGKIGGWTITSNSLSAENISLNASYGAMKFSSNGKVVFTQNSRGSMYYTQYTDDRNYNALLFGRTGIKPVHKDNSDEEEIWLNDIEPDENWVLKYTSNRVVLNANVVNTDTAKIKNVTVKEGISVGGNASVNGSATFEGQIKFRDWENLNKDTPVYRHPIASTTTDGTRIAYISCAVSDHTPVLKVNGQWGSTGFMPIEFIGTGQISDVRLKENIKDSNVNALEVVRHMKTRQFDWKKGGHQSIGFVADELEEIDQNFVFGGGYENGKMNIKQINTPYLVNYVIKAIQELSETVSEQDRHIKQLEQKAS